jgi:hypothetical protein
VLDLLLLSVVARLCPNSTLEVELVPGCAQHFSLSGPGDDQQTDSISRGLIWIGIECRKKALNLLAGQPSLSLVFMVPRNAPYCQEWLKGAYRMSSF